MSEWVAAKPTLVSVPETTGAPPALRGSRCRCGHTSFPPQPLGCNACGAVGDEVADLALAASGTLRSFAMASRQKRPGHESPLIVGAILLDGGPQVEVVIDAEDRASSSTNPETPATIPNPPGTLPAAEAGPVTMIPGGGSGPNAVGLGPGGPGMAVVRMSPSVMKTGAPKPSRTPSAAVGPWTHPWGTGEWCGA